MFNRAPVLRKPACSFLRALFTLFYILWMTTLPITDSSVTPCQFLHPFRSLLGSLTIRPFFHLSGIFSSCHILLNNLVSSFIATSLSFLYNCWDLINSWCFSALCLLQCLPHLLVVSILPVSTVFTSCSSTGFAGASLTNTSSTCPAHLSSQASLSFIISPFLFLTAATYWCFLFVIFLAAWYSLWFFASQLTFLLHSLSVLAKLSGPLLLCM